MWISVSPSGLTKFGSRMSLFEIKCYKNKFQEKRRNKSFRKMDRISNLLLCVGLLVVNIALAASEFAFNGSHNNSYLNKTTLHLKDLSHDPSNATDQSQSIHNEGPVNVKTTVKLPSSTPGPRNTSSAPLAEFSKESKFKSVWCYCNFPECVPKRYMCKSTEGGCFTKNVEQVARSHHNRLADVFDMSSNIFSRGCVESLTQSERSSCLAQIYPSEQMDDLVTGLSKDGYLEQTSYLQCCNQDVCNYETSQPVFIMRKNDDKEESMSLSKQFAWFKTTTIVVSATGLIILLMLMFLAGKMLRTGDKRISQSQTSSREYSKPSYYFERTLASAEDGSILCAKTLQREDLSSFCGLQQPNAKVNSPFALQNVNRTKFYLSSPMSGASCSTISSSHMSSSTRTCDFDLASQDEIEPLTRSHRHSDQIDSVLIAGSFPT